MANFSRTALGSKGMALPLSLPVAAVVLFGALFGGRGNTPETPSPLVPNAPVADAAEQTGETREKTEVWATRTWPLHLRNPNTNATVDVRFYTDGGQVDVEALAASIAIANPNGEPLAPRVLLLMARAAYFFGATNVEVLSGYRSDSKGTSRHHSGEAVDFKLEKVDAGLLATHLRMYGQVGVGIYTHPGTRYVHLDTRETSFHWVDASPPGKTWRERGVTDATAAARDRAWTPEDDKPLFLSVAIPKRRY